MNRLLIPAVALASVVVTGAAQAAIVDPVAAGYVNAADVIASESSNWANEALLGGSNSANPGFPGFPGYGNWPRNIAASSGDAELTKLANGAGGAPYPSGSSIYYGGGSGAANVDGGTLAAVDSSPLVDLNFVTFQLTIGEATGYDFFNNVLPSLSYNDLSQNLVATSFTIDQVDNGTFLNPDTGLPEALFNNTYYLTWDLSDIEDAIETLSISFTGVQHAQLYALRLDQYVLAIEDNGGVIVDPTDPPAVVPTPSALGLALVGGLLTLARRRRQA